MKNFTRFFFSSLVLLSISANVMSQDAHLSFPTSTSIFASEAVQNSGLSTEVNFFNSLCSFSSGSYSNCFAGTTGTRMQLGTNLCFLCIKTPNNTLGRIDIVLMSNNSTACNAIIGFSADSLAWDNFQELEATANNANPSCMLHSVTAPVGAKYFKIMRTNQGDFVSYTPVGTVGATVRMFTIDVWCRGSVAVDEMKSDINDFTIAPNPTQTNAKISYTINKKTQTSITVYSITGQAIETLIDDEFPAGAYCFDFDCSGLAKGAYVVTLQVGQTQLSKKMIKN